MPILIMEGILHILIISLIICAVIAESYLQSDLNVSTQTRHHTHHRTRRYIVFPEGSTFNVAFCITIKATTGPDSIFTSGVNWGMSYDLPNETIHDREMRYEFPVIIRRHKRDLYYKMEKLIDSAGISGSNCVLKTICEAGQRLAPRQGILEEIFRILFMNPYDSNPKEPDSKLHRIYHEAHEKGAQNENCNDLYPCPVSFLDLGLSFGDFSHAVDYYS